MKRFNHKCPGAYGKVDGFPGNCRTLTSEGGTPHCTRHQDFCDLHKTTWMKSSKKHCPACNMVLEKERYNLRDRTNVSYEEEDEDGGDSNGKHNGVGWVEKLRMWEILLTFRSRKKKGKKHTAKGGRRVSKGVSRDTSSS